MRDPHRDAHRPRALDPATRAAVLHACGGDRQAQDPLPLFHEDIRTVRKPRAPSVRKQALQAWLQSKAGQEWTASRSKLWASIEDRTEDEVFRAKGSGQQAQSSTCRSEGSDPKQLGAKDFRQQAQSSTPASSQVPQKKEPIRLADLLD